MKKAIIAALLPIAFSSCNKSEKQCKICTLRTTGYEQKDMVCGEEKIKQYIEFNRHYYHVQCF